MANYPCMFEGSHGQTQTILTVNDTVTSAGGMYSIAFLGGSGLYLVENTTNAPAPLVLVAMTPPFSCKLTPTGLLVSGGLPSMYLGTLPAGYQPYCLDVTDSGQIIVYNYGNVQQPVQIYPQQQGWNEPLPRKPAKAVRASLLGSDGGAAMVLETGAAVVAGLLAIRSRKAPGSE